MNLALRSGPNNPPGNIANEIIHSDTKFANLGLGKMREIYQTLLIY